MVISVGAGASEALELPAVVVPEAVTPEFVVDDTAAAEPLLELSEAPPPPPPQPSSANEKSAEMANVDFIEVLLGSMGAACEGRGGSTTRGADCSEARWLSNSSARAM